MKIDPEQDYRPVNLQHKVQTSVVLPALIVLLPVAAVAFVYRAELVQLVKAKFGAQRVVVAPVDSSAPRQIPRQDSASSRTTSRNLAKLHELTETCRFWRARSNEENTDALRQAACDTARNFALSIGEPMPYIGYAKVKVPRPGTDEPVLKRVAVPDCGATNWYGSIRYRQCRANVKAWLHRECLGMTQYINAAGSRPRDSAYTLRQTYCSMDASYKIVEP